MNAFIPKRLGLLFLTIMLVVPSFQRADNTLFYKCFCGVTFFMCVGVIAIKYQELAETKKEALEAYKALQVAQLKQEELVSINQEHESLRNDHKFLKVEHESLKRELEILDQEHQLLKNDQSILHKKNDEFQKELDANKQELLMVKGYIQSLTKPSSNANSWYARFLA